jgi:hypothetical protein
VIIPLYYGRACELCGACADGAEDEESPRRVAWHEIAGKKKWFEGRDYYPLQGDNRLLKKNITNEYQRVCRKYRAAGGEPFIEIGAVSHTTGAARDCGT